MSEIQIFLTILGGLILTFLFLIKIPYEYRPDAKKAGFGHISMTYFKLKLQKMPIKFLFQQYVKALEVNISLEFEDLREYLQSTDEKHTENMVSILIRAKRAGVKVDINELEKFELSGGNPEKLVEALKVVRNANIDISQEVLETHSLYGGDIEAFVEIVLRAKKADLELDMQALVEENLEDEDMKKIVNILIRMKKAGLYITKTEEQHIKTTEKDTLGTNPNADLRISQQSLLEHFRANIDIEKYASAMILAKKAGIEIDKQAMDIHYLTDGDMEKLVSTMIKAERSDLNITQKELVNHNIEGRDIENIIKNIIKAKQAELDLTIEELVDYHRLGLDVEKFVKALINAKKNHLGIGKKELEEHYLAGADVAQYVTARKLIADNPEFGLKKEDIDDHYLKGGNVLKVIYALQHAQRNKIPFGAAQAMQFDLIYDLDKLLDWSINPQVMKVEPPVTVVGKDGIQLTPKLSVTVRGKLPLYVKGSKEQVLFGRVNEAVAEEIHRHTNYKEVLNHLDRIAENVRRRLQGTLKVPKIDGVSKYETEDEVELINKNEHKLNESSAYEVLDIKVYDIEIGHDTLADFKVHHAEHEKHLAEIHLHEKIANAKADEAHAKARLAEAKAKVEEGIAEGFRTGTLTMKDKLKQDILFPKEKNQQNSHGNDDSHNDTSNHGHH